MELMCCQFESGGKMQKIMHLLHQQHSSTNLPLILSPSTISASPPMGVVRGHSSYVHLEQISLAFCLITFRKLLYFFLIISLFSFLFFFATSHFSLFSHGGGLRKQ